MENPIEPTGWDGIRRSDGLLALQGASGDWVVVSTDDRPPIVRCPCCRKGFKTDRHAKLCANAIYSLENKQ